ncbi:MAG: zinc-dependent alcohol dehydrogenase [Gammaproteobacteria bacterium]
MKHEARAVFHTAPGRVELKNIPLPQPKGGEVLIRTQFSAVSPGTEAMIFSGRFPQGASLDATISSLRGGFDYPFRYGYALVGEVEAEGDGLNGDWLGRRVFAFHPHQDCAAVPVRDCLPVPDDVSSLSALLLPNVESAVNFAHDAAPLAGENALVMGQGVVGLLTTALLAEFPLTLLAVADPLPARREAALRLGAMCAVDPGDLSAWENLKAQTHGGFDLAVEVSGNPEALNGALDAVGFGGRVLVGSWYSEGRQAVALGGDFHRNRINLYSTQVSSLNPVLSGRWDKRRRIGLAWRMIRKIRPESLITHRFTPERCQEAFELARSGRDGALQIIFEY